jgi:uncharacterized RmlC-like cupin family protein
MSSRGRYGLRRVILGIVACFTVLGPMNFARAEDRPREAEIVVIRPVSGTTSKQGLPLFVGISGQNAGSKAISMNKVVIPPGASARAHRHTGYETVIYLLKGRVKTLYGEGLRKSVINEAGDFIYIPADLPHKPINLSDTDTAEAIVARTDPNEQESVEHVAEPELRN